jgi:predicted GNAT family acetyltransferase
MSETTVTRNDDASRYEIHADGVLAGFVEFTEEPGRITFTHTETLKEFSGQGMGSELAQQALADAVAKGLVIVPVCPFIDRYLQRHEFPGAIVEGPAGR